VKSSRSRLSAIRPSGQLRDGRNHTVPFAQSPSSLSGFPHTLGLVIAGVLLVSCSGQSSLPQPRTSQAQQFYRIVNLGGLGGTVNDSGVSINDRDWVAGAANLPGNHHELPSLWRDGKIINLGTVGGANGGSATVNDSGVVVGAAQSAKRDPFGEGWAYSLVCKANGGPCRGLQNLLLGFQWKNGVMKQLPTLGGNNGWALSNNNRGEAVGVAETAYRGHCARPQVLVPEAVVWGPQDGEIRELPPFKGDKVAIAWGNNDLGDAVGSSGPKCGLSSGDYSAHGVLWRHRGPPIDLGTLGGVTNNYGNAINNHEQIAGESDLTGDTTAHATIWQNGVLTDLGTLPGDISSSGNAINDQGQVVGQSCDASGNCRAFIWQDGAMTDLNTLIAPGPIELLYAKGISSDGEIVGQGFNKETHRVFGFLAIPSSRTGAFKQSTAETRPRLPSYVRSALLDRSLFGRYGIARNDNSRDKP